MWLPDRLRLCRGFPSISASALSGDTDPFSEPGAGSRAVRRFLSDRSSQTLDTADGSSYLGRDEACAKRGFVLVRILWQPLAKIRSLESYALNPTRAFDRRVTAVAPSIPTPNVDILTAMPSLGTAWRVRSGV